MELSEVVLFLLLFFLSGFFSASELAIMSIPHYKINSILKSGKKGALSLKKVMENSDKLLITILIGNNLVNTYTAVLATQISIKLALKFGVQQAEAIGISTGIVTFLLLMFGEIIPKSIATKNAITIALKVSPIYNFLMKILYPLIFLIEKIVVIFSKNNNKKENITKEEFSAFLDIGKNSGLIENEEHKKIKSILEFSKIPVSKIMTPKESIEFIDINNSIEEVKRYYVENKHFPSRLPVFNGNKDNVESFITIRDIISAGDKKYIKELNLRKLPKVDLEEKIDNLFFILQKSHKHIAIVTNRKGNIVGIITLENIIEELFGEIKDEKDRI